MTSETSPVVVVGVDGSQLSDEAVRWADQYANSTGAVVRLVTAWQWAMAYGAPMMFEGYAPSAEAQAIAEKARSGLSLPADRVEIVVNEGPTGPVLVGAAEDADLLVVGSQGHNAVSKVLLGSASSYCLHHASCPVVVVR